jgi:hypothetical protein
MFVLKKQQQKAAKKQVQAGEKTTLVCTIYD